MLTKKVEETCRYFDGKWNNAKIALVLGSGLSSIVHEMEESVLYPYSRIPHFPEATVQGHRGELALGKLEGKPVAILAGRIHYYEGYSMQEVTFPVRVLARLGVRTIVLTNAAGGLDSDFKPGDVMVIQDHLNFIPENPLRGQHEEQLGKRFVSLANAYNPSLRKKALECGKGLGILMHEGIYAALPGPSFETPAEIKLYKSFGASAVGMSTVPEVIVARQAELDVLALSLITNVHGDGASPSHEEVLETARNSEEKFMALLKCVVRNA